MKRIYTLAIMIIFIGLVLTGCGNEIKNSIQEPVSPRVREQKPENLQANTQKELQTIDKSDLRGIAYNRNNTYVAVGTSGQILTSTDGVKWLERESGTDKALQSVIWNKNQFVTVGDDGTILTSKDGCFWQTVNSGTKSSLNKVIWDGRRYIALCGETVLTSIDGDLWIKKQVPDIKLNDETDNEIPYYIADVLWDGKQYIATGGGNFIITSEDFEHWVVRNANSRGTGMFCGLEWNGKRYVAIGDHLAMTTSLDGRRWTEDGLNINKIKSVDDNYTLCLNSVVWGADKFIVVGHRGLILNSKDGLEWSVSPTSNTRAGLNQVVWDGKKYVAVGDNETIIYSSDGMAWDVSIIGEEG